MGVGDLKVVMQYVKEISLLCYPAREGELRVVILCVRGGGGIKVEILKGGKISSWVSGEIS